MHLVHVCAFGCVAKLICYITWPSAQDLCDTWPVEKGMTSNPMITGDSNHQYASFKLPFCMLSYILSQGMMHLQG